MQILLANPCGFCAGVKRAICIVENVLEIYSTPIYIYNEIVHNSYVVNNLSKRGVVIIKQLNEVPDDAILIFSAHGVSQKVRNKAKDRNLITFDATCPLVKKIHMEVIHASLQGEEVILIGHAGHPEVEGTIGQYNNQKGNIYLVESLEDVLKLNIKNNAKLSFVTQTTFSVDEISSIIDTLRKRFPQIIGPRKNDICYATTNRQEATRALAERADIILVIGSINSSNANRLAELVQRIGKAAYLIDSASDIQETWIKNVSCVGVTAGASTPDILIQNVLSRLRELGGEDPVLMKGCRENIIFEIPKKIRINTHKTQ